MTGGERQTIAIVGAGLAGWMTAAILARRLPRDLYAVRLISDGVDATGVGIGEPVLTALPSLRALHAALGIDEEQLVRTTGGAFALGIAFSGWSAAAGTRFLPFGAIGAPLRGIAFPQLAARARAGGREVRFANFSVAAIAAQSGRFARPHGATLQPYGLQLAAEKYASVYRRLVEGGAVRCAAAPLRRARLDEDGSIAALELANGETIKAMLYLDCSGVRATLARGALDGPFESWSACLPCTKAEWVTSPEAGSPALYTHAAATEAGWVGDTPLPGSVTRLRCWNNDLDTASEERDSGTVAFESGRLQVPWLRNCVALGAAAGVIEPLHPFGLQLLHSAVLRLIGLFPHDRIGAVEAADYNRRTGNELDSARDVVAAHYSLSPRSKALELKVQSFESRGRVPMFDDEVIEDEDWVVLLDLLGLRARRYDTLAEAIPMDTIDRHFAALREAVIADVRAMPAYGDYLQQLFATPSGQAA